MSSHTFAPGKRQEGIRARGDARPIPFSIFRIEKWDKAAWVYDSVGAEMKKVLVADDRASGRELIRTVLEQCGHSVFETGDGIEAVRKAQELLPDLIILDLHMPELDGFGALREIRADERLTATPIVALTASAMQGDRERALSAGFTSYLAKPISLNVLRSELGRLLGKEHASVGCR